jgi:hypothetical protein
VQELVLTAARHALDNAPAHDRSDRGGDGLALRGMVGAQLLKGSATDGAAQAAHGEFNFR